MLGLTPWREHRELDRFRGEMDRLFDRFFDLLPFTRLRDSGDWMPAGGRYDPFTSSQDGASRSTDHRISRRAVRFGIRDLHRLLCRARYGARHWLGVVLHPAAYLARRGLDHRLGRFPDRGALSGPKGSKNQHRESGAVRIASSQSTPACYPAPETLR